MSDGYAMKQLRNAYKAGGVVLLLLVTACAPATLTNKNADPSRRPLHAEWPLKPGSDRSMLVVVNSYTVRCCGASPTYSIRITAPGFEYANDHLIPVDDFFCVVLDPGDYRIELQLKLHENPVDRNMPLSAQPGTTRFVAAEVNTVEPEKTQLHVLPERQAMVYVNRALDRILRPVWASGKSLHGNAARRSPLIRRELRCDGVSAR